MQAVILAAGRGSRLHPLTQSRSKPMLPILGKPIVERVIENFTACGLSDFIVVVNPKDYEIKDYFRVESTLEVNIRFVDQSSQLGMANALIQAMPLIGEDFLLAACDTLVSKADIQHLLSTWAKNPGLHGLLSLLRIPITEVSQTGIVTLDGDRVTNIVEKPSPGESPSNISSLPIYCFSIGILDFLPQIELSPRGEYELQDAIQTMIEQEGDFRGLFFQSKHTLTSERDLLEINLNFLQKTTWDWPNKPQIIGHNTQLVPPLYIGKGTIIGSECNIGPCVYIEGNVQIGNGVRLHNVVVLKEATIPDGFKLSHQVVTS